MLPVETDTPLVQRPPWMVGFHHIAHFMRQGMCINGGGLQVGMAQHQLDGPYVCTSLVHVGGKGMPKAMGRYKRKPRTGSIKPDHGAQHVVIHGPTAVYEKVAQPCDPHSAGNGGSRV